MRRSGDRRHRRAGCRGLLPLRSCRSWSAAPVNAFSLWKPEQVKVTKGERNVGVFRQDGEQLPQVLQDLWRASADGSSAVRPGQRLRRDDPDLPHEPQLHVHYQETVLRIKDGLPKMKDLPKEMGGSGELLPE